MCECVCHTHFSYLFFVLIISFFVRSIRRRSLLLVCLLGSRSVDELENIMFGLANISKHFAEHNIVYMKADSACSEIKIEKGRPFFVSVCGVRA